MAERWWSRCPVSTAVVMVKEEEEEEEEAETTCWMTSETEAEVKWTTCQHPGASSHTSANNNVLTSVLAFPNKALNSVVILE